MVDEIRVLGDIEGADNFGNLYEILRRKQIIIGSNGREYKAGDLIELIEDFREDLEHLQKQDKIKELTVESVKRLVFENEFLKTDILNITRSEGLRNRVVDLAINEVIERGKK